MSRAERKQRAEAKKAEIVKQIEELILELTTPACTPGEIRAATMAVNHWLKTEMQKNPQQKAIYREVIRDI